MPIAPFDLQPGTAIPLPRRGGMPASVHIIDQPSMDAINAALVARLYKISHNQVVVCRPYDPALAFKITIRRPVSSGDLGESDVYGCQQHVPLTMIEVPSA